MSALRTALRVASISLLFTACGAPSSSQDVHDATDAARSDVVSDNASDVATDTIGGACHADTDCSDGVFCNGVERCMPGAAGANARGCVAANPATPCLAGQTCDEATAHCATGCGVQDADGDGHMSIACGGDDCDDTDPNRFPGNPEVCLTMMAAGDGGTTLVRVDPTHDEDCDPGTYASGTTHDGDHDGDGYVDTACSNTDRSGMRTGGTDCEDLASPAPMMPYTTVVPPGSIHPSAPEVCNGVDDNCDGTADNSLPMANYYPDCDADSYGVGATPMNLCAMPSSPPAECAGAAGATWAMRDGDCDDTRGTVHPTATEVCNGIDDNCDGMIEPDADSDGHFASGSCIGGLGSTGPGDDCRDDLANAHPGQTTFFGAGGCAAGTVPCVTHVFGVGGLPAYDQNVCIPSTATCPAFASNSTTAPMGPATFFDFNCDGTVERELPSTPACMTHIFSGGCSCLPYGGHPPAGQEDSLTYTGAPLCGSSVQQWSCTMTGACLTGTCSQSATTRSVPMPCR